VSIRKNRNSRWSTDSVEVNMRFAKFLLWSWKTADTYDRSSWAGMIWASLCAIPALWFNPAIMFSIFVGGVVLLVVIAAFLETARSAIRRYHFYVEENPTPEEVVVRRLRGESAKD